MEKNKEEKLLFNLALRLYPTKGALVYEYNPLKNLRSQVTLYLFDGIYVTVLELFNKLFALDRSFKTLHIYVNSSVSKIELLPDEIRIYYNENVISYNNLNSLIKASKQELEPLLKLNKENYSSLIDLKEFLTILLKYKKWFNIGVVTFHQQSDSEKLFGPFILSVEKEEEIENEAKIFYNQSIFKLGEDLPTLIESGLLIDFQTNLLNFSLNNPVSILPLDSYDGSVNLILNDYYNEPRMINTRFSNIGNLLYEIVDREGGNDSNIYNIGESFDINISLYKSTYLIPNILFLGTSLGGDISVGTYHFYFKLEDADGNLTDFIGESRAVLIFKGFSPEGIDGGFRQENSYKKIIFNISNIDKSYLYVRVYYTIASSDINENFQTTAWMILDKYPISSIQLCYISITGNENKTGISVDDLNQRFQIYSAVKALESAKNRLFFGNVLETEKNYTILKNIALHFLPVLDISTKCSIDKLKYNYMSSDYERTYYNPVFTYKYTGYWNHEIYRFGVVFIYNNNTLSPVFNTRGRINLNLSELQYTSFNLFEEDGKTLNIIPYDEETYYISQTDSSILDAKENVKGVVLLESLGYSFNQVLGITFQVKKEVINYLKSLGIKGLFFVRLKRIPTILCQAYVIGSDLNHSYLPLLPTTGGFLYESIVNSSAVLTLDFEPRIRKIASASGNAAICPEYDINYPYYNSLFTGEKYPIRLSDHLSSLTEKGLLRNFRHLYQSTDNLIFHKGSNPILLRNILGVEDNVKLVAIDTNAYKFRSRAGEAEDSMKNEFVEYDSKSNHPLNIVRGSFGPYLGLSGTNSPGTFIDIMIPEYSIGNMEEYIRIRSNDHSSYYSISDRYSLESLSLDDSDVYNIGPEYGGDCYICQFTHRFNRNFSDPEAPTNDRIVDSNNYANNYLWNSDGGFYWEGEEGHLNRGDLNAINLGMWVTIPIRSSVNLNIRSEDSSYVDEAAIYGHPRTFYPKSNIIATGSYKIPEALCINKGLQKITSERINVEIPTVPAYYTRYTNRVAYSQINITDLFINGFRIFPAQNYRDYSNKYGAITKLLNINDDLLCICERGILKLPINEKVLMSGSEDVYINTNNVLPETPIVVSDTYGSSWAESIVRSEQYVYGIDSLAKKIWKTNGQTLDCISDFNVQLFLNNILLKEFENVPIIGIRNIKAHYNKFKNDIMFTFYNYYNGFEDSAWNLCYNERLKKWVTFYSWIPSHSENIGNLYFSFNRDSCVNIVKLGISNHNNDFSKGITLGNNVIPMNSSPKTIVVNERTLRFHILESDELVDLNLYKVFNVIEVGQLFLEDELLEPYSALKYNIDFTLEKDIFNNYKLFSIYKKENSKESYLFLNGSVKDICSELYENKFKDSDTVISDPKKNIELWKENIDNLETVYDERGRKKYLKEECLVRGDQLVTLLNISALIREEEGLDSEYLDYLASLKNHQSVDSNYMKYTIAVMPEYNMKFLSTDFWKHGQSGIIDISDEILPTHWYGKLHPFEFEITVADNPTLHKIFDNLQIISNNAEPESFHYEIVGDCYDFANEKKNMYIRLEATKNFLLENEMNIHFDSEYTKLESEHKKIKDSEIYKKSTIFPLHYYRLDKINTIEDYYHSKDGSDIKDSPMLTGSEISRDKVSDEYSIITHSKAISMQDGGVLRGNMLYKEDRWDVQISPILYVLSNEDNWAKGILSSKGDSNIIPVELNYSYTLPDGVLFPNKVNIPKNFINEKTETVRQFVRWEGSKSTEKLVKIKDKYIKIKIRYNGKKLAIISALKTLYSISYS